ncbi:MAG TPA: SET domain-containing protein [Chitinophagaceae bacterium]|nr:SET domain-containing protein [Chitinophagaceae bacterium]
MILPLLYIAHTDTMGRGVFTSGDLPSGTLLEVSPVLVLSGEERQLLDQTLLHDYIFEWGEDRGQCCVALGYVSLYNHAYQANCEYQMDFDQQTISVRTVRAVQAGEELFLNYNGDWNDPRPVWFDPAYLGGA